MSCTRLLQEDGGALTAVGDEIRGRSARPTRTEVKEPEEKVEPAKKTVEVEKQESDKLRQLRRGLEEEQEREGSRWGTSFYNYCTSAPLHL